MLAKVSLRTSLDRHTSRPTGMPAGPYACRPDDRFLVYYFDSRYVRKIVVASSVIPLTFFWAIT